MSKIANTMISAAMLVGVAFSAPAKALPIAKIYEAYPGYAASTAALITPDQPLLLSGARLDRLNEQTVRSASQNYFDFDAIITLGTLALAGSALAIVAYSASRRTREEDADERTQAPANWQEGVLRNLEADLTAYARSWRRAA